MWNWCLAKSINWRDLDSQTTDNRFKNEIDFMLNNDAFIIVYNMYQITDDHCQLKTLMHIVPANGL